MIGALNGTPLAYENGIVSLACGEIVYEINVPSPPPWVYGEQLPINDVINSTVFYWTHANYPEKGTPELYGFREREERDLFRRLLKIDGVGCKVAMRIVGAKAVIPCFDKMDSGKVFSRLTIVPSTLLAVRGVGATLAKRIQEELAYDIYQKKGIDK
jgi:Holliday junction resolvasome RuvABC DNA-binding subunit